MATEDEEAGDEEAEYEGDEPEEEDADDDADAEGDEDAEEEEDDASDDAADEEEDEEDEEEQREVSRGDYVLWTSPKASKPAKFKVSGVQASRGTVTLTSARGTKYPNVAGYDVELIDE